MRRKNLKAVFFRELANAKGRIEYKWLGVVLSHDIMTQGDRFIEALENLYMFIKVDHEEAGTFSTFANKKTAPDIYFKLYDEARRVTAAKQTCEFLKLPYRVEYYLHPNKFRYCDKKKGPVKVTVK